MAVADEPPAHRLGLPLDHEEDSEQRHSELDTKEVIEDDKGI